MRNKLSIYTLLITFFTAFLGLVYYVGLLQTRSLDSSFNLVILFMTMMVIGPLRSYLSVHGTSNIRTFTTIPHFSKTLFLALLLIFASYFLLYILANFNELRSDPVFSSWYVWLTEGEKGDSYAVLKKVLLLFSPLYILYLVVSFRLLSLQKDFKYSILATMVIALIIFFALFSELQFEMGKYKEFRVWDWISSPYYIFLDLLQFAMFLIILIIIYYIINPFFMQPAIRIALGTLSLYAAIPAVIAALVGLVVPGLIALFLVNTFFVDIYFFYYLEYIVVKTPTAVMSLFMMLLYLLISFFSVRFIFQILSSLFSINKKHISIMSWVFILAFYGSMGYHKYSDKTFHIKKSEIRTTQTSLGRYFCEIKQEDINWWKGSRNHGKVIGLKECLKP